MKQENKKQRPTSYQSPAWLKYLYIKVIIVFSVGFFIVDDRETWKYVFWSIFGVLIFIELCDWFRFWWKHTDS